MVMFVWEGGRAGGVLSESLSGVNVLAFTRIYLCMLYGGWARYAGGLSLKLNYGIRTAKWAKTEVTMQLITR